MNEDKVLTNYDKFVMSKNRKIDTERNVKKPSNVVVPEEKNQAYSSYLLNELRRTQPSGRRVMTENEFMLFQNTNNVAQTEKRKSDSKFEFKKGGKILFAFYVIFMVALAFILIVSNTTGSTSGLSADAVGGAENSDKSVVRSMTVEEEDSEESNWFDRLCDSLNK